MVKLYVATTADDALDHVKLIDVAFDDTTVQLPVNFGAETNSSLQGQTRIGPNFVDRCLVSVYGKTALQLTPRG